MATKQFPASLVRLLDAARRATAHLPPSRRIEDFDALRVDMGQTAQAWNQWKDRGLSKDGALLGEQRYGSPAVWLLSGTLPARWPGAATGSASTLTAQEPPSPFGQRRPDCVAEIIDALAALPPMRYASVRAVLDQLPQHPEMRDDAAAELRALLAMPSKRPASA